ncbi:hypothetical protein [Nitrosospira sp. Is2]|uniref:hypothetical protein n=1 Tax=Nitrosospira sp. Is2 TaxID=3080532 RepID=UPI00295542A9|nr:hypothetical protein [Nitrosospira sp. Is2]WON74159.1 hypothetical protein R5L00_01325 [Nitrosospira sp. Is2]
MLNENEKGWFEHPDSYRILMNRRWDLEDLYHVPHAFQQCYSFIYCFHAEVRPISSDRIESALRSYPWRGGYSYVNLYTILRNQIEWRDRPRVAGIIYGSPGWIDLALNLDVALEVAKSVTALSAALVVAAKSYATLVRTLSRIKSERKKNQLEFLKLSNQESVELKKLCNNHAKLLGFESLEALNKSTGSWDITASMLLAHHRRLKQLVDYMEDGKINLPTDGNNNRDD